MVLTIGDCAARYTHEKNGREGQTVVEAKVFQDCIPGQLRIFRLPGSRTVFLLPERRRRPVLRHFHCLCDRASLAAAGYFHPRVVSGGLAPIPYLPPCTRAPFPTIVAGVMEVTSPPRDVNAAGSPLNPSAAVDIPPVRKGAAFAKTKELGLTSVQLLSHARTKTTSAPPGCVFNPGK